MTTATQTTRFHLSLNVRSLRDSVAFYRDVLGHEPDKLHERFARFTSDSPALVLSLVEQSRDVSASGAQRISHMGIRLESAQDFEVAHSRLAATGRPLREEHESRCCYALQDKFWLTDPDGNEWEFYRLLDDLATPGDDSRGCCD